MTTASGTPTSGRFASFLEKFIEWWALAGGILLVAVVLVTATSLAGNILFHKPVPGDFEIVEVCVAVAVFAFLPYCQITDSNVTADIFTAGAGPRLVAVFSLIASVVALGFSALLLWRMSIGMIDSEEVTMVYQFPIWYAFVPIVFSLFLLAVASLMTLTKSFNNARQGRPTQHPQSGFME